MYDEFLLGVSEGIKSSFSLLPILIGLMTAVGMFCASGASEMLSDLFSPLLVKIGIPEELASLLLIRPISGSASNAMVDELFIKFGPDSFVGRCASVIAGSSDTIIYITALYLGKVGVKRSGAVLPCAFTAMIFSVAASCAVVRVMFG